VQAFCFIGRDPAQGFKQLVGVLASSGGRLTATGESDSLIGQPTV
jgi:hypothetical protein